MLKKGFNFKFKIKKIITFFILFLCSLHCIESSHVFDRESDDFRLTMSLLITDFFDLPKTQEVFIIVKIKVIFKKKCNKYNY